MYVCVCNAVSDRAILAAIDEGAHSLPCLMDRLGVATACGTCEEAVREQLVSRLRQLGKHSLLEAVAA
ncbi:(2Fe-2S)-binding protein [Gammaproteobacteria bacterium AB-CW1]|uniref:Bacterioferritin-associated ferredoxin n=1 Tax=Natronospira elongata TaxID=3110268 RepID=A0AAP6JER1_9GAMM|nr:(2Fe-2S)-binding protein [Gammaproteobacteria bacterium AB-CW1]